MNKHEIFMIKASDYLNKIIEINRSIKETDKFTFFDYKSMYYWKRANDSKLVKEYRENIIPSEERLEEIMIYARIYDELYKSKKIRMKIYEEKILQYFIKVSELQRNIDEFDEIKFLDNTSMTDWYEQEHCKLLEERKNNITPTKERMEEIMLFANLEKFINEIEDKNYIKYSKKVNEYLSQIKKLGRNIKASDNICFSDGENMFRWYEREYKKYREENENNVELTEIRKAQRKLFSKIIEKVKEYKPYKLSLKQKYKEYISMIRKLGRNIRKSDSLYFSDGTSMYNWHNNINIKKIRDERKNQEKPEGERLEKLICFAKIYDELYEQKKLKLSIK